jgi:hypothetical protein
VDGISLREGWDAVNPAEDVYDWSYFDAEITKAQTLGKGTDSRLGLRLTHEKLDVVRTILEDPAVQAPAEQIHEVLNNKKSCMIFESELQRVWPGEKEKR